MEAIIQAVMEHEPWRGDDIYIRLGRSQGSWRGHEEEARESHGHQTGRVEPSTVEGYFSIDTVLATVRGKGLIPNVSTNISVALASS